MGMKGPSFGGEKERVMRFSDAIRLGAMLRKQAYRSFLNEHGDGTCAIGAALEAVKGKRWLRSVIKSDKSSREIVAETFPEALPIVANPVNPSGAPSQLYVIVAYLNDTEKWTREQIADWVDTVIPRDNEEVEVQHESAAIRDGIEGRGSPVAAGESIPMRNGHQECPECRCGVS
jgi:hypothetical protein